MLSATQLVSTTGTNKIVLPNFDENLGTLQQADVTVSVGTVATAAALMPDIDHTHDYQFTVGTFSQQYAFRVAGSVLGSHTHTKPLQTFGIQTIPSSTDSVAPIHFVSKIDTSIYGQSHSHALPNIVFDTINAQYLVSYGSTQQFVNVGGGTATNGVFVPKIPSGATLLGPQVLSVQARAVTLPAASAGNFSHTHSVTTASAPFASSGSVSTVNPTGNSSHSHLLNINVTPKTFTSSADLTTYFANGSNVNLTAAFGSSFGHTHTVPNLPTTATTTFTYDARPFANSGGPYVGNEGDTIRFDGSASSDDVGVVSHEWDFDYAANTFTTDATGPVAFKSFARDFPTRMVALRVTDTLGQQRISTSPLTINNVAPQIQSFRTQSSLPGVATEFDLGSLVDPGTDGPYDITVNWGDGSAETVFPVNVPGPLGFQMHTFATLGDHYVTVRAKERTSGIDGFQAGAFVKVSSLPKVTLSVSNMVVSEGVGTFTARMQLDSPAVVSGLVNLVLSGTAGYLSDYSVSAIGRVFSIGETSFVSTFTIIDDQLFEGTEQIAITLDGDFPVGNNEPETVQITDNESPPRVSFMSTSNVVNGFFLDFSGKGEVRFRSFDLGTGRWIFAGIRSCVQ